MTSDYISVFYIKTKNLTSAGVRQEMLLGMYSLVLWSSLMEIYGINAEQRVRAVIMISNLRKYKI